MVRACVVWWETQDRGLCCLVGNTRQLVFFGGRHKTGASVVWWETQYRAVCVWLNGTDAVRLDGKGTVVLCGGGCRLQLGSG